MSITQITEQEQRLTNTLRMTTEALKQVAAERDALQADAERYRWLRSNGLKYSFDHQLIGLLLSNKTELDAVMKEQA